MRSISELVDLGLDVSTEDQGEGRALALLGVAVAGVAAIGATLGGNLRIARCAIEAPCSNMSQDAIRRGCAIDPQKDPHLVINQFPTQSPNCDTSQVQRPRAIGQRRVHITAFHVPELRGKTKRAVAEDLLRAFYLPLEYAVGAEVSKSKNLRFHPNTYTCEFTSPVPLNLTHWEMWDSYH